MLRVAYRDQGRRTGYGPGFHPFEYVNKDANHRGSFDTGPKTPGVPRIMVIGDSITYGQAVRDWRDLWPEIMVNRLRANGRPHELAVVAESGHNLSEDLRDFDRWVGQIEPDILVYQFFVNDIDIWEDRELNVTRWWQRSPWHQELRASYLYFVLDFALSKHLPPVEGTYTDYLLTRFAPGTLEGEAFEHQFRTFRAHAGARVLERWMVMYPLLPFTGDYPLQPLHDRVRALAESDGFRVVDPTRRLNSFNTYVSLFDGHPNERAQRVVGEAMAEALLAAAHP